MNKNNYIKYSICIILSCIIILNSNISATNLDENSFDNIVLITGFGPFDNNDVNPSELLVESLNGSIISDYQIIGIVLSVDFIDAVDEIKQAISIYEPDLILSFGLAASAKKIKLETIAINLKYNPNLPKPLFSIKKVNNSGPILKFSTFNIKDSIQSIKSENIAVVQSIYAGLYVCNTLFYDALFYLSDNNLLIPMGFVHLPQLESINPDGMQLSTMIQAAELIIKTNVE